MIRVDISKNNQLTNRGEFSSLEEAELWVSNNQHAFPSDCQITYIDITTLKAQEVINEESLKFLNDTDWLIVRHIGQKALGIETSLTQEEYLTLENDRQLARERINR